MTHATIRIAHEGFPDGYVINEADFDPSVHTVFGAAAIDAALTPQGNGQNSGTGGAKTDVTELLAGDAASVIAGIKGMNVVPELQDLRSAEVAGKNRKTVLAAIDAALTPQG